MVVKARKAKSVPRLEVLFGRCPVNLENATKTTENEMCFNQTQIGYFILLWLGV